MKKLLLLIIVFVAGCNEVALDNFMYGLAEGLRQQNQIQPLYPRRRDLLSPSDRWFLQNQFNNLRGGGVYIVPRR